MEPGSPSTTSELDSGGDAQSDPADWKRNQRVTTCEYEHLYRHQAVLAYSRLISGTWSHPQAAVEDGL